MNADLKTKSTSPSWVRLGAPALVLAPMEGVMDAPMRALLTERGGITHCVSEFLRISQEVPPLRVFAEHMPELLVGSVTPSGVPIQLQLLGGHAERLARSAVLGCEAGAMAIDLNFGCPAPTVNRHDGGASLLRYPERIREIVATVRAAVPAHLPVSAKLRLGWESMDDIFANAEQAYLGGAAWLTIHARTKMQGYRPPAHWKYIAELRRRLPIPIIANGEIWTLEDFLRCREETGCEHFMIGRGALADPALLPKVAQELGTVGPKDDLQAAAFQNELRDWETILKRFAVISAPYSLHSQYTACRIKQWVKYAEFKSKMPWSTEVKRSKSLEEIFQVLGEYKPVPAGAEQADLQA